MRFIEPVTLRGQHVVLEPLALEHLQGLGRAAADGELWRLWYTSVPAPEGTAAYIDSALAMREHQHAMPFVVREVVPVLREIGTEQEQAAFTLGATSMQTFWRVTLPAIRIGVAYGVVLTTARVQSTRRAVTRFWFVALPKKVRNCLALRRFSLVLLAKPIAGRRWIETSRLSSISINPDAMKELLRMESKERSSSSSPIRNLFSALKAAHPT